MRTVLDNNGDALSKNSNCGVRVAEGQHRSYVTDFIRDARAGGCAAGLPPSNLGFRLIREPKNERKPELKPELKPWAGVLKALGAPKLI